MLSIRRILFATDFSASSHQAYGTALRLAHSHGAELHVLHALTLAEPEPPSPMGEEEGVEVSASQRLFRGTISELMEKLHVAQEKEAEARLQWHAEASDGTVTLVPSFRRGTSPASVILAYAEERDVDLVIIGSHGRRGIRRALLGSVAEEVVRLASCPILTVRGEPAASVDVRFDRIVVPIDFSMHSDVALRHAAGLARLFEAEIHLIHVVHELLQPDFYYPSGSRTLSVEVLREKAAEKLEELAERHLDGQSVRHHVRVGRAAHEIVELAKELPADVIVISSHGLTGVPAMLLGSQTAFVVRRAPCSVLTVKPYGKLLTQEEGGSP